MFSDDRASAFRAWLSTERHGSDRSSHDRRARRYAVAIACGLGIALFSASTAMAGETYSYEHDVWPHIQSQTTAGAGSTRLASAAYGQQLPTITPPAQTGVVNGAGQRVDASGIPVLQDRGADR